MAFRKFDRVASLCTSLLQLICNKTRFTKFWSCANLLVRFPPSRSLSISFLSIATAQNSIHGTEHGDDARHFTLLPWLQYCQSPIPAYEWIQANVPAWPLPVHPWNILCFQRKMVLSRHVWPACLFPPGHWWSQSQEPGENDQAVGPGHGIGSCTCGPTSVCWS